MSIVPAERPTCATCIHYRLLDEGEPRSCTRFPPQVVPDVYDDVGFERDTGRVQEVKTLFATQWPTPEPRHGCGEHPDFAAWFEAHGKRERAETEVMP